MFDRRECCQIHRGGKKSTRQTKPLVTVHQYHSTAHESGNVGCTTIPLSLSCAAHLILRTYLSSYRVELTRRVLMVGCQWALSPPQSHRGTFSGTVISSPKSSTNFLTYHSESVIHDTSGNKGEGIIVRSKALESPAYVVGGGRLIGLSLALS